MRLTTENPFTNRFIGGAGTPAQEGYRCTRATGARGAHRYTRAHAAGGPSLHEGSPVHQGFPLHEGLAKDAGGDRIQVRLESSLAPDPPPPLQHHQQAGRQQEQSEFQ